MFKRLSLCLCLLMLAACGSQQDNNDTGPTAPAGHGSAPSAATSANATPAGTATSAPAATSTAPAASTAQPQDDAATAATARQGTSTTADQQTGSRDNTSQGDTPTDNNTWVAGKNYVVINPRQPVVKPGDKINVTEVFSYGCPACNQAHIWIDKLKRSLPDNAVMTYLPAAFRPDENWVVYQRAYFAAKALGVAEKSYDAMFDAVFQTGEIGTYSQKTGQLLPKSKWPDINTIATFYSRYDIKPEHFVAVANSFSTNLKMKQADDLVKAYSVPATPNIVIDGRYRFGFGQAGGYRKGIELAHYLIKKAAAERAASGK